MFSVLFIVVCLILMLWKCDVVYYVKKRCVRVLVYLATTSVYYNIFCFGWFEYE